MAARTSYKDIVCHVRKTIGGSGMPPTQTELNGEGFRIIRNNVKLAKKDARGVRGKCDWK